MEIEFGKKDLEVTNAWPDNSMLEQWVHAEGHIKVTHINYKSSMGWGLETLQFVLSNGLVSPRAGH